MVPLFILCVAFLCTTQAQVLPLLNSPLLLNSPCQQVELPCSQVVSPCQTQVTTTSPVVATTIVDNSVSNALANALQLLIVSNLIENTMTTPCNPCNTLQATVTPLCDTLPIKASVYSPIVDVITPDYYPYMPYEPIVSPCDYIPSCDPIIDIIPTVGYPEVVSYQNVGCGCGYDNPLIPNVGCGNIGNCGCGYDNPFIPNVGCGNIGNCGCSYDNPFIPNIGCGSIGNCGCSYDNPFMPNVGCGNFGNCGCGNSLPNLQSILPSLLPNIGGGCNNLNNFGCDVNPFGVGGCGCDQCGPAMFPQAIPAKVSYGYPPSYPIGVSDPWCYDPCPNNFYGNPYYY